MPSIINGTKLAFFPIDLDQTGGLFGGCVIVGCRSKQGDAVPWQLRRLFAMSSLEIDYKHKQSEVLLRFFIDRYQFGRRHFVVLPKSIIPRESRNVLSPI
jgi:hypothetical protein